MLSRSMFTLLPSGRSGRSLYLLRRWLHAGVVFFVHRPAASRLEVDVLGVIAGRVNVGHVGRNQLLAVVVTLQIALQQLK